MIIPKVEIIAKELYMNNPLDHSWAHAKEVWDLSIELGNLLDDDDTDVDFEALAIAAILHDIDYSEPKQHVKNSAKKSEEILTKLNYPEKRIVKISEIILNHSYTYNKEHGEPKSIEGKILFDADHIVWIIHSYKKGNVEWAKDYETKLYFDLSRSLIKKQLKQ